MQPLVKRASKVSGKAASKLGFFMNPLDELRQALGDANLVGLWWGLSGVTAAGGVASNVLDARGSGFGGNFTATSTAQPAYDPVTGLFTFNGTANFLQNNDAALTTVTSDCAVFIVGTFPALTATDQRFMELGDTAGASGNSILIAFEAATTGLMGAQAAASVGTGAASTYPGTRVLIGRRQNTGGGNILTGVQVGLNAEVTGTTAGVDRILARIVVGAARNGTSNFAGGSMLAWGLVKGTPTAAMKLAITEFALELGAAL